MRKWKTIMKNKQRADSLFALWLHLSQEESDHRSDHSGNNRVSFWQSFHDTEAFMELHFRPGCVLDEVSATCERQGSFSTMWLVEATRVLEVQTLLFGRSGGIRGTRP